MSARGRHSRRSGMTFYRDALLLIGGIVLVGAIVFGGLSLWAGSSNDDPGGGSTTVTTDPQNTTTTTSPATTTTPTSADTSVADTTGTTTAPTAPETTVRQARPPGDVRVIVLNSIGVTGLAAEVSQQLADVGYQMGQADNYTPELSDTMIFHADGFAIEAVQLAESIPDGTVASDPELTSEWGVDIVVVIGRSYQQ
ncbi:MAG TPA: LytR C-terminal domain-containing protein [Acidimicrobiia bacterium]|nr:LytR C-terminal domain-containing protein [Acidimicrobiia bacterium]